MLVERPPRAVEGKVYLVSVPLATLLDCTFSRDGMMVGNDVVKGQVRVSGSTICYVQNDISAVNLDGWWSDEHVAVLVGNQVEAATDFDIAAIYRCERRAKDRVTPFRPISTSSVLHGRVYVQHLQCIFECLIPLDSVEH